MELFSRSQVRFLILAVWLYRLLNSPVFKTWHLNELPLSNDKYTCQKALGMASLHANPGSEDVAISYKYNVAFATVGLRYAPYFEHLGDPKFTGIFIYSLASAHTSQPIKIPFKDTNPHGLSIFELDEEPGIIRVAFNSHKKSDGTGEEEIIVFDYDSSTQKQARPEIRLQDSNLWQVNDIAFVNKNSLIATNDHYFVNPLAKTIEGLSTIPLTSLVYVKYNETGITGSRFLRNGMAGANGVLFRDNMVVINEPLIGRTSILSWKPDDLLNPTVVKQIVNPKFVADNPNFDESGDIIIGGASNGIAFMFQRFNNNAGIPGYVMKIDKDTYDVKIIHHDLSGETGAYSSAVTWNNGNEMLIGSPFRPLQYCTRT